MINNLELRHVKEVSKIHFYSWNKKEFSVKLGQRFIELFYTHVCLSDSAFGQVFIENNKVIAYACGFYDLKKFQTTLMRNFFLRLTLIVLTSFFKSRLTLLDIKNNFFSAKTTKKSSYPNQHLGALAVRDEYKGTQEGRTAVKATINKVLNDLNENYPGCHGICNEENIPMRKYLEKLGFYKVEKIDMQDKKILLFDLNFNQK